jgi:hypothetical protein
MVRKSYSGITNPKEAFERLRPFRQELIRMKSQVRPFGQEYLILDAVDKALTTTAYHFTREPDFYSIKPHSA